MVPSKLKTQTRSTSWTGSSTIIWDSRLESVLQEAASQEDTGKLSTLQLYTILNDISFGNNDVFTNVEDVALGTSFFETNPSFMLPNYSAPYDGTQDLMTITGWATNYPGNPRMLGGYIENPTGAPTAQTHHMDKEYATMDSFSIGFFETEQIFSDDIEAKTIDLTNTHLIDVVHRFIYGVKFGSEAIQSHFIICATTPTLTFDLHSIVDGLPEYDWNRLYLGEYCLSKQFPDWMKQSYRLTQVNKVDGNFDFGTSVDTSKLPGFENSGTTYVPTPGGGISGQDSPSAEGVDGGSSGGGNAPSGGSSDSPFSPGGGTAPTPGVPGNPGNSPGTWQTGGATIDTTPSSSNILNSGLIRAYAMSDEQVKHFASELWSDNILDQLAKWLDNPMDVVLSLTQFPFEIYKFSGSDVVIKFNWLNNWDVDSRVLGTPLNRQYFTLDFGTITVPRYSGTFYDFQPYTQAHCYIPYVGFVPIKASEVVGSTLRLTYTVDCIFGNAVANLISGKYGCIGTYNCTIGVQVPLTSRNMMQLYTGILKAAVTVATAGVGAGLGAAETSLAGSASTQILQASNAVSDFAAIGAPEVGATAANAHLQMAQMYSNESASVGAARGRILSGGQSAVNYINSAQSALNGVMSSNAPIQRSGSFDALSGRLSSQNGYLVLSIPHQNYPGTNYDTTIGFPSNIQGYVGNFYGYTKFRSVEVKCSRATVSEIEEIQNILQGGIINANLWDNNYYV